MRYRKMSNVHILAVFTLFLCLKYGFGVDDCHFRFGGLPIQNMDITTNATWNKTVLTINITYENNVTATSVTVMEEESSSPYFEIFDNELFAISCPPVGESHLIQVFLEKDSTDNLDACSFNISVTVEPSVPQILVNDSLSVLVSSMVDDIDVVNFTLVNTSTCSNFSCSVTCTNDEKSFWIHTNIIRTSPHDITYNSLYELALTCYDGGRQNNKTDASMIQVNFMRMSSSGNSAKFPASFTRGCVYFVLCAVHVFNNVFKVQS